jgi:hypothetical protein
MPGCREPVDDWDQENHLVLKDIFLNGVGYGEGTEPHGSILDSGTEIVSSTELWLVIITQ